MADFVSRLESRQVNKRQIEMLACAGAFDGLNANRAQLHQAAEIIVRHAAAAAQERDSAQENLFGGDAAAMKVELPLPQVEDWPAMERLRHEFAAIGFYLSAHPLDAYQASMEKLGVITYRSLVERAAGGRCKLGGIVIGKRELNSRKGSRMAFVQCTDTSGVFEVTAFSEILSRARELLDSSDPLLFTLSVEWQAESDEPRLTLQDIEPMEKVAARSTAGLRLFLEQTASLESVKRLLERDEPGRGRVYLVLDLDEDQEIELELPVRHRLSAPTRQALKAIPGVMVQDL
jgi:DNA polymerase-3 subunit alpha